MASAKEIVDLEREVRQRGEEVRASLAMTRESLRRDHSRNDPARTFELASRQLKVADKFVESLLETEGPISSEIQALRYDLEIFAERHGLLLV